MSSKHLCRMVCMHKHVCHGLKLINKDTCFIFLQPLPGLVYTRWGKTYCPSGTDKVYDGIAAGSQHTTKGSGANFVCLTKSPVYSSYQSGTQNLARIAPIELHPNGNIMGNYVWDRNPPCVVCHTTARKDVLMVPGTTSCPTSWRREYYGYLMAPRDNYYRSDFICMDKYPQALRGSEGNTPQAADLFNIEAHCSGNILCPPYNSYKEITCAVCTK